MSPAIRSHAHPWSTSPCIRLVVGEEEQLELEALRPSVFCGIDWAEDHHDVALVDAGGAVLARLRIGDDAAGYTRLLAFTAYRPDRPTTSR